MHQRPAETPTRLPSASTRCESQRCLLRRIVVFAVAGLLAVSLGMDDSTAFSAEAAARPNVIVIMADDIGVDGLNCYGGTSYRTPRLDQMAAEGQRFIGPPTFC